MFIETLLLVGSAQAFFLAFVLIFNKRKELANKWLIVWLIFIGIHLVFVYLGFAGIYRKYPLLLIFGSALMLLQGPFFYVYTSILTAHITSIRASHLLHAIPYFIYTTFIALTLFPVDSVNRYEHISELINDGNNIMMLSLGILNHLHIIIYLILSILLLKRYTKGLTNTFSYLEGINLNWLKNLLLGITAISVIILLGLFTSDFLPIISHYIKASFIFSALAVLPFYMSFYAIRQRLIYPTHPDASNIKYETSSLTREQSANFAKQLKETISSKKLYLNPKLTIKELSEAMELHPKVLSRVINENFENNFFNFINSYRVEEFKVRVANPANNNYKLIAIAYDCGFNTKSSFNAIFKKFTGLTPSAYKAGLKLNS